MILPHPESDLNFNIMVLGSEIIKILRGKERGRGYILVETVLNQFLNSDEKRTPTNFIHTLIFLYSIGLIDRKGYKIKLTPIGEIQGELF
jgi:hypothetical protein